MKFADAAALWRRIPAEHRLLGVGATAWAVGLAAGLPIIPATATQVILSTYIAPLCVAALVQLVLLGVIRIYRRGAPVYLLAWGTPTIAAAVFLFYQFKSWTPLINPRMYDGLYQRIDDLAWPLRDGILEARLWLAAHVPVNLDTIYYTMFVLMFLVALVAYGTIGTARQQRRLLVGICASLLIGGVSYWVAPAAGPFIYRSLAGEHVAQGQQVMLAMYRSIHDTGVVPANYFGVALGAMPSMHFAFAIFFLAFTYRTKRWLAWWYWVTIAWFLVDSVFLGWHYLVDIAGGAVVAAAAYYLAARLIPSRDPVPVGSGNCADV